MTVILALRVTRRQMKKIPRTVTTVNLPTALLRRALARAKELYGKRGFSAYVTQLINRDLSE